MRETLESERAETLESEIAETLESEIAKTLDFVKCLWYNVV